MIRVYPLSDNSIEQQILPLVDGGVKAGFPTPAPDVEEIGINLNEELIRHPATTFLARVDGNSMEEANILDKDILVVDRDLDPQEGDVVICCLNNEFTVKRLQHINGVLYLVPANKEFEKIEVVEGDDLFICGVVTYCIHKVR